MAGSIWLSRSLDEFGARFHILSGSMVGADSPEISSALTAMLAGEKDVGVGVVLGLTWRP